jgi:DNA-binding transcriptional regulator GbsR (MarR family)
VQSNDAHWANEQQRFVEEAGLLLEDAGLPRMAGRIVGRLLICDEPYQSAGQLASALRASAGSISSSTRALIQFHLIERVALPGDRKAYFQIRPGGWIELLRIRLQVAHHFVALVERGLALAQEDGPQVPRLTVVRDVYSMGAQITEELIQRWERTRGGLAK